MMQFLLICVLPSLEATEGRSQVRHIPSSTVWQNRSRTTAVANKSQTVGHKWELPLPGKNPSWARQARLIGLGLDLQEAQFSYYLLKGRKVHQH